MSQWRFFLHLSILQTYGRKHLSKRKFRLRLRLQVSNNFGSTGSGSDFVTATLLLIIGRVMKKPGSGSVLKF